MSMCKLAFQNVKSSFRNYASMILSLTFTVIVFLNFQNITYSDVFQGLGGINKERIDSLVQVTCVVLGCFLLFFVWYATNVFLTKKKKEIGIYVFMGLTNEKIAKLYLMEMTIVGFATLFLGLMFGTIVGRLFQMVLCAISEIGIELGFHISKEAILITACVYLAIYLLFVCKGYVSIVRSSVMELISANKQNEYVKQNRFVLLVKTIVGVGVLGSGYFLAIKDSGMEFFGNMMGAVILVILGVYLIFGGLLPMIFQALGKRKRFLYCRERTLWVNQTIFRMKKNYRTYAMVCVLMLCSVCALAGGFAMKGRYHNMVHFRNTYTFQVLSNQKDAGNQAKALIQKENEIVCDAETTILQLDASLIDALHQYGQYAVVSWGQIRALAKRAGLEFTLPEPAENEIIDVSQLHLMSVITDKSDWNVTINGKTYRQTAETSVPYLGYLQEQMSFYMVNDAEYQKLRPLGTELYTWNYRIKDIYHWEASREDLRAIVSDAAENYTAYIAVDPYSSDIAWIKVLYSLCVFMFMVFLLAGGSILFMKVYNDAYEEKERYQVLQKIGFSKKTLKKSIANELKAAYILPFLVMAVSSWFAIHALEKLMTADLLMVNLVSVGIILVVFVVCYFISFTVYLANAEV